MTALAIDTSTEILSLCAVSGGGFFELSRDIDLRHSEEVLPLVDWLLSQLKVSARALDFVAVSRGPGSFTGLRIGMATAQGLAAGAGCPVIGVPTLDIYGQCPAPALTALPLIDAKKKRFYAAFYRAGQRLTDYMDASPEEILVKAAAYPQVLLTGPHAALLLERLGETAEPQAAAEAPEKFILDPGARAGKAAELLRLGGEAFRRGEKQPAGLLYLREPETT